MTSEVSIASSTEIWFTQPPTVAKDFACKELEVDFCEDLSLEDLGGVASCLGRGSTFTDKEHFRAMLSGPGVSVCKPRYNTIIWRAENRTHLSKQTRPSTERSRKASNVRCIPSRSDDQLKWVLIVRTQV